MNAPLLKRLPLVGAVWFLLSYGQAMAFNHTQPDETVEESAAIAIKDFTTTRGLDVDQASTQFIGFDSVKMDDSVMVEIFSVSSDGDSWIDVYECELDPAGCSRAPGYHRCFYHPLTGAFSITDFKNAIGGMVALGSRNVGKNKDLNRLKLWQSEQTLFGRVEYIDSASKSETVNFACHKNSSAQMTCMMRPLPGANEP
jgi:hypothetical protein